MDLLQHIISHLVERFRPNLSGPVWIARLVEVRPGVMDSEIVYVTPEMDQLYGYMWPDTLVGRRIADIHTPNDVYISRQYALMRHWGLDAPQHYVMHGLHPNGRAFRVVKHVYQYHFPIVLWVTRHEPWHRRTAVPSLTPPTLSDTFLRQASLQALFGHNMEVIAEWLRLAGENPAAVPVGPWSPATVGPAGEERPPGAAPPPPFLHALRAPPPPTESFGTRLHQARKAQGLSLRQAAARIQHPDGRPISHQFLNAMERGHRKPSFPLLQEIGRVLHFDVMPLLTPAEGAEFFLRTALRDHPEAAVTFLRLFSWVTQHGDTGVEHLAPSLPALGAFRPRPVPAVGPHRTSLPSLPREEETDALHETLVGSSAAMQHLRALIRRVAALNATVLISGETGVGKELVAHALPHQSPRCHHPFVIVDCTALQESLTESTLFGHERGAFTDAIMRHQGAFERAHTGTIFLDEVHSLSLGVQAKLLRVLQARAFERVGGTYPIHVDVRVIATSNKDLSAMVAAGTFRDDLFHRLNVLPLHVPPLRARADDIPLLVQHFLQKHGLATTAQVPQLTPAAYAVLARYPWPGNVRELEHVIMRLVSFHGPRTFDVVDLPPQFREG